MYKKNSSNAAIIEPYVALLVQKVRLAKYLGYQTIVDSTLESAISTLEFALAQDNKNTEWQGDWVTIEALLLLSQSTIKTTIDADNTLNSALALNSTWALLLLAEYFQLNNEWNKAKIILSKLPDHKFEHLDNAIPSFKFTTDVQKLNTALVRHVQRQHHDKYTTKGQFCLNLLAFSEPVLEKTSHPGILLPYLFSTRCVEDKNHIKNIYITKGDSLAFPYYFKYLKGI